MTCHHRCVKRHAKGPLMKPKIQAILQTLAALLVSITVVTPHTRAEQLVTFELDPIGARPNGFQSIESPFVSFHDTVGDVMTIVNFPPQTIGNSLRVLADINGSAVQMNFTAPIVFLSLSFGNDDPNNTIPGDLATLSLFDGATQVGQTSVVLNRDDIMNQTIEFSGVPFDRAIFGYTNSSGSPFTGPGTNGVGLSELVDNVRFRLVPEPAAAVLLMLGSCGIGMTGCRMRSR